MRSAGILLHITSLPSDYPSGDLGPGAYAFADFLAESYQEYWQVLPITPVTSANAYSPYSSDSGMAGNVLLISPDGMSEMGLLDKSDLVSEPGSPEVSDLNATEKIKNHLFDKAWKKYQATKKFPWQEAFDDFIQKEDYWLGDYALYVALKKHHQELPWYSWPDEYKLRQKSALKEFTQASAGMILREKLLQFVFHKQWMSLHEYCISRGVRIFGDLPFYLSYDSAEVWSSREMFNLHANGTMAGVAGVPPDYFSATGQLWGMPTYNWESLRLSGYRWWIRRIQHSMQLFDKIRIDHFRAFDQYWEVPPDSDTAEVGEWKDGPGENFFKSVQDVFGDLPIVAEDLGDKMERVHELCHRLRIPGMRVLLFAFGDHLATSIDIPHNYERNCVCYTGTHDNNTVRGWYVDDASDVEKQNVSRYLSRKVDERNVSHLLCMLAYASVARLCILPMQDVLNLDGRARMNKPGMTSDNWKWRMAPGHLNEGVKELLREWTNTYHRGSRT